MLTWSFGCTSALSPRRPPRSSTARLAITSFAFMLVEVPEPVWNTSTTNSPSSRPSATSPAARSIASASLASRRPSPALTRAHAALMVPSARRKLRGKRSPEIGKFSTARAVCALDRLGRDELHPRGPPPLLALEPARLVERRDRIADDMQSGAAPQQGPHRMVDADLRHDPVDHHVLHAREEARQHRRRVGVADQRVHVLLLDEDLVTAEECVELGGCVRPVLDPTRGRRRRRVDLSLARRAVHAVRWVRAAIRRELGIAGEVTANGADHTDAGRARPRQSRQPGEVRDDASRAGHAQGAVRLEEVALRVAVVEERGGTPHQIAGGAPGVPSSTRTPCASVGRRYQYSPSPASPVGPAAAMPARRSWASVSSMSAVRRPRANIPSPRADRNAPGGFVSS